MEERIEKQDDDSRMITEPHVVSEDEQARRELMSHRSGAITNAFDELNGIINKSALTRDYFQKSQAWFSQRLHNSHVCRSDVSFKPEEARRLAGAFRDIARRLSGLAGEIEAVADID